MNSSHCNYPISVFFYWMNHSCAAVNEVSVFSLPSIQEYLVLFFFTCLFETPIYWWWLKDSRSFKDVGKISLILNLATHPLVVFGFPYLISRFGGNEAHVALSAELFAPLVEATLLVLAWKVKVKTSIMAAFSANLFSWLVGGWFLIRYFF